MIAWAVLATYSDSLNPERTEIQKLFVGEDYEKVFLAADRYKTEQETLLSKRLQPGQTLSYRLGEASDLVVV